jgi:PIN domain nuclease of toxin-antitoxin system
VTSLLLDTHTLLWFFWDDAQLSPRAKELVEDANNRKLVSIASCWEIAIKVGLGKLNLGESSRSFLPREIARNNFEILSISLGHATTFDRLLAAQAVIEGLPLISADGIFDQYGINRLW